jgi:hypothetical protein
MWGIFIGVPLGVLQIYGIMKYIDFITTEKKQGSINILMVADLVLLLGVFILIGLFAQDQLLWTATGMVGVMIISAITIYIIRIKRNG